MDIIIVSNRFARPVKLNALVFVIWSLVLFLLAISLVVYFVFPQLTYVNAANGGRGNLKEAMLAQSRNHQANLDALAMQIGEIQARLLRLDALGEKLSNKAGIPSGDLPDPKQAPGQGGPDHLSQGLNEVELQQKIDELMANFERQSDRLSGIEASLVHQVAKENSIPSSAPIEVAYNSSSYGWRIDPFHGRKAFHEGLDYPAAYGTPVYAAAEGIVTTAEQTPDYGKLVKIDHGNGFETRYGHNSFLLVKAGDHVARGQRVALVGSTGRSTGPHLHFEIRLDGLALDPKRYLKPVAVPPKAS